MTEFKTTRLYCSHSSAYNYVCILCHGVTVTQTLPAFIFTCAKERLPMSYHKRCHEITFYFQRAEHEKKLLETRTEIMEMVCIHAFGFIAHCIQSFISILH